MSEPQDMVDSQVRNEFGMPLAGWVHRGNGGVYAPVSASVNSALNWAAALFGGLGFGGLIVLCLIRPWETSDRAIRAEIRSDFAQQIEALNSAVSRAKQDASQAKDWTDQRNTELKTLRKSYDR